MQLLEARRVVKYSIGKDLPPEFDVVAVVNEAATWLTTIHEWNFMVRTDVPLDLRPTVTLTAATWNPGTLTLSQTGKFATYVPLAGDLIRIDSGTGVTLGYVEVRSRTDADSIVLASSISSGAPTDVAATLSLPYVALPANFGELLPGYPVGVPGSGVTFDLCDPGEIGEIERGSVNSSGSPASSYLCYVSWARNQSGVQIPRLRIRPECSSGLPGGAWIAYRAIATPVLEDTKHFDFPGFVIPLFKEALRAYAKGIEEEDEASTATRLAIVQAGPAFEAAIRQDAFMQPTVGPVQHGAIPSVTGRAGVPLSDFTIGDPS